MRDLNTDIRSQDLNVDSLNGQTDSSTSKNITVIHSKHAQRFVFKGLQLCCKIHTTNAVMNDRTYTIQTSIQSYYQHEIQLFCLQSSCFLAESICLCENH